MTVETDLLSVPMLPTLMASEFLLPPAKLWSILSVHSNQITIHDSWRDEAQLSCLVSANEASYFHLYALLVWYICIYISSLTSSSFIIQSPYCGCASLKSSPVVKITVWSSLSSAPLWSKLYNLFMEVCFEVAKDSYYLWSNLYLSL